MTAWARRLASPQRERIVDGWALCATPPGEFTAPAQLQALGPERWVALAAPAPAAAALRAAGRWSLDGAPRRFDAEDWWYRVEFTAPAAEPGAPLWLGLDGLAGVAEVWLNGERLLHSTNMFVAHEYAVDHLLRPGGNALVLRFHALDALLAQRRPRPRWRAPMVEHQQLRWFRSTLLGRTPGWSPPAAAVGPWKDVWIERRSAPRLQDVKLTASVAAGGVGELRVAGSLQLPAGQGIASAELELERAGTVHRTPLAAEAASFRGTAAIADVALWWPHTHGEPALYSARLCVRLRHATAPLRVELGAIGFRTIVLDTSGAGFALRVNDVPVFCRGACWTPLDAVSLRATPQAYVEAIAQVRDAGMNMLRVGGTMVYEDAAFFDACDAAGVLVWQEFMFANMDYPEHDADFMASVRTEVAQQLEHWQGRPSLALLCGNSEGEQQAAMWGAPRECWSPPLFHETLPQWVREGLPGVPYWPSSAHGGAFPHQSDTGTSSYYGVGAYLRPLEDARRADLRFATECLGLANVPEDGAIARMPGGHALRVHHPAWKLRAPRDLGAGWDFEDVRDHYLAQLYETDPLKCRYADHERYLALSRAVSGEVMSAAFAEWRRPGSNCGGALVWFLRDLWAGAGWGVIDDAGMPKACWHYLRRALQPRSVSITDEGGNGLYAHMLNERSDELVGELEVTLYGSGDSTVAQARRPVRLAGRGGLSLALAECFDDFFDLSYAYRFGPPSVTLVHARLCTGDATTSSEALFLPAGRAPGTPHDVGLTATLEQHADGHAELVVGTTRFAHTVCIELEGCALADNYFHLAPGSQRRIAVARIQGGAERAHKGRVGALNSDRTLTLQLTP